MKRIFLSLAILACISLTATVVAQKNQRGQHRLSEELNLTEDQQQKIKSMDEENQLKMNELKEQHHLAVNDILTPEQQAKFKELKEQKDKGVKEGKRSMAKHGRKGGRDMRMKAHRDDRMKDLNLTEDQKQKINALDDTFRAKGKEMAQQHREALNNIYTPEQQAKIKDMKGDFRKGHKFAFDGKRGKGKLDEASMTKLKTLRDNFEKEKKAVESSSMDSDAQKKKISELRDNFRKEKHQIMKDAHGSKTQEGKPV